MNRNDAFSRCHPLVNFLYFALVLLGAMLLQHPVCQAISLIGAIACSAHSAVKSQADSGCGTRWRCLP